MLESSNLTLKSPEFWRYRSSLTEFDWPELPDHISRESSNDYNQIIQDRFHDHHTDQRLISLTLYDNDNDDDNDPFTQITILDDSLSIFKRVSQGLDSFRYYISEDYGSTFKSVSNDVFNYLLRTDKSLSEIEARAHPENPQFIFNTPEIWNSLFQGKIPNEFIGRIEHSFGYGAPEEDNERFYDRATHQSLYLCFPMVSDDRILSLTDVTGTYEMVRNNQDKTQPKSYFFTPPGRNRWDNPQRSQITQEEFFQLLQDRHHPLLN